MDALEKKICYLCGELRTDCPVFQRVRVNVTLEHAIKADRGNRGIALLFL
jgi:hypothetical protein